MEHLEHIHTYYYIIFLLKRFFTVESVDFFKLVFMELIQNYFYKKYF